MAISLKHAFTSPKSDGTDSTLVQPSNWNEEHQLTMAAARLIGRTTAGPGAAEEISVGSGLSLSGGVLSLASSVSITALAASGVITGGSLSISGAAEFTGTGALKLPVGTTAQRPTPAAGQIRFNSTTTVFEGHDGAAWGPIGGTISTQPEAEAGTDNTKLMTPLRTKQSIAAGEVNLIGGYTATEDNDGTFSSGTYTPTPVGGNTKTITNSGAFTIAAPTASGSYTLIVHIINSATAGAITLSGFAKSRGDAFTITNGHKFNLYITRMNGVCSNFVEALQ